MKDLAYLVIRVIDTMQTDRLILIYILRKLEKYLTKQNHFKINRFQIRKLGKLKNIKDMSLDTVIVFV